MKNKGCFCGVKMACDKPQDQGLFFFLDLTIKMNRISSQKEFKSYFNKIFRIKYL